MVIAWVGLASVGIFMARYMKVAFGDKELLGTKMWFTVRTAPCASKMTPLMPRSKMARHYPSFNLGTP